MQTLVITPCLGAEPQPAIDAGPVEDAGDPEGQQQTAVQPGGEPCTSTHHRLVMEGVQAVWERWGRGVLTVFLLSRTRGLFPAHERTMPNGVKLDDLDRWTLADEVVQKRISDQAAKLVRGFDLAFYLLSDPYLSALELPLDVPGSVQQILLTSEESLALVQAGPNLHLIVADGPVAAQRWHVKAAHVRGFLFKRLCHQITHHGPLVLEWLYRQPFDTEQLFYKRARWRPQWRLW
jgi:hypothetical protein